ncbi:hypothetical protein H4N54_25315 [Limnospira fusiformis KN01]|uniref:Uncharacterized protein n=1 Tax=Limnospira maxima CS-328 TaxID=513049 RepID=B5VZQ8_LIMMA|nr:MULTISPECIES: hypothetical protein [Limnospira]EDZ95283.1 hypothetical protein AmaxDRAFT_1884 [Limnospira maxima CS-328]MDC0838992.1 hypothetical protein [Limnoraphis robusta]ULB45659.1 hypothetical protein H4N54_25315 [Limnospira fusiformis KN01]
MKAIGFLNFKTDGLLISNELNRSISDNRSPLYFSIKSPWGFFTTGTQRTPNNESDRLDLKSNLIRAIAIYIPLLQIVQFSIANPATLLKSP